MPVNIAVIDDDEAILDSVKLVLEEQQWRVRTYTTGEEFLADVNNHGLNCVILDPHLPGVSGVEVARSVARDSPGVPIIGLTAQPVSPLTLQIVNVNARVMLIKPVSAEVLVDQIQTAINERGEAR